MKTNDVSVRRNAESLRKYIEGLELAEPRDPKRGIAKHQAADGTSPSAAAVDAGSQVSFVVGLTDQQKSDTLNSTLLAQLAASKQVNRDSDPQAWYDQYINVLSQVGWVLQNFSFTQYQASGSTFDVNTVVLEVLAEVATGDELSAATATLAALEANPSGDGATLLNTETHSASQGNFQIAVASNVNGTVIMKLGVFYFSTTDTIVQILGFRFGSSSTSFFKDAEVINLNNDVYSLVRDAVIAKLGDKAQQFVVDLDI
jgi:hypothetical protein